MRSIAYYEDCILESRNKINKYEREIDDLQTFCREIDQGVNQFIDTTKQRRNNISSELSGSSKNPTVKKLHTILEGTIDQSYENKVLDNFDKIEKEIKKTIYELEQDIEDEKERIDRYEREIREIIEEEREKEKDREGGTLGNNFFTLR